VPVEQSAANNEAVDQSDRPLMFLQNLLPQVFSLLKEHLK
jgi:hypothetical protein